MQTIWGQMELSEQPQERIQRFTPETAIRVLPMTAVYFEAKGREWKLYVDHVCSSWPLVSFVGRIVDSNGNVHTDSGRMGIENCYLKIKG